MAEAGEMHNQLKFNLGIPITASNMAVRYHRPNPIIVERAGNFMHAPQPGAQGNQVTKDTDPHNTSQMSSLSEDRMALAVKLAKRDLKKRRDDPTYKIPSRARSPSPKTGHTKVIQSKECKERAKRLQEKRNTGPLRVREKDVNMAPRSRGTRASTPPRKPDRSNLPATTSSPPTRDTDHYPARAAPSDNPGQEIERLQREIEGYLQQIQVVEQKAMREKPADFMQPSKSRRKDGYLSDEEDPARRMIRQEEQVSRAARQVYNLRQQVRALQDQVTRIGPDRVKHTKKSQVMLRLAAAHRGAVRALQSFVNQQLPQQDLRRGLPAGYHELALLVRQLALLSTQIRCDGDSRAVHQDLLRMLDRVEELNTAWCQDVQPAADTDPGVEPRRKSPIRSESEERGERGQPRQRVIQKKTGKENRPKGLLKKQYRKETKLSVRPQRQAREKLTPERQAILRAGLEAMAREADDSYVNQTHSGMSWNIPGGASHPSVTETAAPRSVILPKGLQTKRDKAQKSVAIAVPESHFSDPTLSSSRKVVDNDVSFSAPNTPSKDPWRPSGSVGRSPTRQRSRSQSPGHVARNALIQDMDAELVRELFPLGVDGQRPRGRRPVSPRSPRQRSRSPPRSPRYRSQHQRGRLTAQDVLMAQERRRELADINVRQMLADRAIDKAQVSGEVLSEMILHDLLRDTAEELGEMELRQTEAQEARGLQNNPTLENMYQRLEQMELEQLDIRRRWGTLHFEEETSQTRRAAMPEKPSGPVAMEITRRGMSKSHHSHCTRPFQKESDDPIIFTKTAPQPRFQQKQTPLVEEDDEGEVIHTHSLRGPARIKLTIPEKVVNDIRSNLEKYERHLKRSSHEAKGRFDPWKLVEEISDKVLEDCLKEIDAELDDMGEAIVHRVCQSEFSVPDPPPPQEVMAVPQYEEYEDEAIEEVSPIASEDDYETVTESEEET